MPEVADKGFGSKAVKSIFPDRPSINTHVGER
jgi:hypothetical protein